MNHGDLLAFTGGHVVHSMFPAAQDAGFAPNGFDVRYSLLFRWTTDEMREHGPKITTWGTTILLAVQLYLLLQFPRVRR